MSEHKVAPAKSTTSKDGEVQGSGAEQAIPKPSKSQLRVGRLTKAHGLKGAIKVELYTDAPERRFVPGAVFSLQVPTSSDWHGKTLELIELKFYNAQPVAFFAGVLDRSTAETLIKAILWIEHDPAEKSDEEDAWFDHQLIGLAVMRDGAKVGTISQIDHFPAQDLITVDTPTGDVLVPFVKAIVASVDIEAGTMTVTPPLGLFEEIADDVPDEAESTTGN
ncbi:ribosome maturation factor RimM [Salinibacterium xinjiangense]|uniref:Ribosome maturation factor RimM n=1 Tax=Salinibacterium xinjiangense TaxID=386302 RepID=A0A2C8ZY18_9MICO|nr:ribosome maturation factor RimM [Salinibacterium xinjiangense]SOE70933.1 16S rRNA processing protein RimM [Salinibacterium xinjiangense]